MSKMMIYSFTLLSALLLAGCNTFQGMGKDVDAMTGQSQPKTTAATTTTTTTAHKYVHRKPHHHNVVPPTTTTTTTQTTQTQTTQNNTDMLNATPDTTDGTSHD